MILSFFLAVSHGIQKQLNCQCLFWEQLWGFKAASESLKNKKPEVMSSGFCVCIREILLYKADALTVNS